MKIESIEVEFGLTQNVGDYSNVRPSLKLAAMPDEGEDPDQVLDHLIEVATTKVRDIVDDELEMAGRQVKYSWAPLYQVRYSDLRRCVVIFPNRVDLPQESTWRDKDSWLRLRVDRDHPNVMRYNLAQVLAISQADDKVYALVDCAMGDLSIIPPLPDPGPEPVWHRKGLGDRFKHLRIDESVWEEMANLDHVTADYLKNLYQADAERKLDPSQLIELIRTNAPWPAVQARAEEGRSDYDEDYDDEWDDDEE